MKSFLSIAAAIIMLFSISSCMNNEPKQDKLLAEQCCNENATCSGGKNWKDYFSVFCRYCTSFKAVVDIV